MERHRYMFVFLLLFGLFAGLSCDGTGSIPPGSGAADQQTDQQDGAAIVRIGSASYSVDLAVLPEERQQGLSGREFMAQGEGMLFVFENEQPLHFWMKEMRFPLDMLWIDAQCRLVGVSADVPTPPPNGGDGEIPRAQSPSPARFVLELNAGEAARQGMAEGDLVEFQGAITGRYGC